MVPTIAGLNTHHYFSNMKMTKLPFGKLPIILLLILFTVQGLAQISVYKPFPTYGRWNVETVGPYDPSGGGPAPLTYKYEIFESNGDTVIGSYTYKIVRLSQRTITGPGPFPPYSPWTFSFAYRNDIPAKQVYIYTNIPDHYQAGTLIPAHYQDTLFYDFNLNVGDTLKESYVFNPLDTGSYTYSRRIVASIDSVLICGEFHKQFNFVCDDFSDELVEGMGFADHFMHTFETCPFEPVYLSTTTFSCTLTSANDPQNIPTDNVSIFPNPASSTIQLSDTKNIVLPFDYSITDCLGRLVNKGTATGYKTIDISALENGLYFLMILDKQKKTFQGKFLKQ
ncbi:MAG: hypothetical protein JWP12_3359 [Bacteroidetes bacterium]|nr:hypothetical protein [Bacteroidota bacterium]